jgi:uncharacterized membrane protein YbhN (UPF0104 family)
MKRFFEFAWPLIGVAAVVAALFLLHQQFQGEAVFSKLWADFRALPPYRLVLAVVATLVAYAALAWYDRIALLHLGIKHISWTFIALCSFTTYALAHNIGASVLSGAVVRYRAYTSKGLNPGQIAILVALCSLTFGLGVLLLGGLILICEPQQLHRLSGLLPNVMTNPTTARTLGAICLGVVVCYVIGSIFKLKPFQLGKFRVEYPRPGIAIRQLLASSMELIGAAGIIYFALPEQGNPGFIAVLAVFIASFSAALASNAPGGLGVFELLFIKAMPAMAPVKVLTALLVFRMLYLILPLAFAVLVIIVFERRKLAEAIHHTEPGAVSAGSETKTQDLRKGKGGNAAGVS